MSDVDDWLYPHPLGECVNGHEEVFLAAHCIR
jgi:hypothetical protein